LKSKVLESDLQKSVIKYLELIGCLVLRMPGQAKMHTIKGKMIHTPSPLRGIPDLQVITPHGRVIWIELKTPDGVVSDYQKEFHTKLTNFGQNVFVLRSLEEVCETVRSLTA